MKVSLQYLMFTRPDIAFVVNTVCQFMHSPTYVHFGLIKRILKYLQGTLQFGVTFSLGTMIRLAIPIPANPLLVMLCFLVPIRSLSPPRSKPLSLATLQKPNIEHLHTVLRKSHGLGKSCEKDHIEQNHEKGLAAATKKEGEKRNGTRIEEISWEFFKYMLLLSLVYVPSYVTVYGCGCGIILTTNNDFASLW
ncbi:transposable element gene [Prunus dulcis]|uniref:Transposable element protein n=1 Tax=Prunus dulcis TaxID=3755 RepID=A0A4Y1RMB9_PRUDU|nr:transposable element gene [Prunus dulcis]